MKKLYLYLSPVLIAFAIMAVGLFVYLNSYFSSVQQSINELKKLPAVEKVFYSGEGNQLLVTCKNGKEVSVKLEDTFSHYEPVIANLCK